LNIAGKRFLVVGLGKTGLASARFLKKRGAEVTISDSAEPYRLGYFYDMAREMNVRLKLGRESDKAFEKADN